MAFINNGVYGSYGHWPYPQYGHCDIIAIIAAIEAILDRRNWYRCLMKRIDLWIVAYAASFAKDQILESFPWWPGLPHAYRIMVRSSAHLLSYGTVSKLISISSCYCVAVVIGQCGQPFSFLDGFLLLGEVGVFLKQGQILWGVLAISSQHRVWH